MSLKDKIKRRRRIVAFCPDLSIALEIDAAQDALDAARKAQGDRLASKAVKDAEKALAEVKARAEATILDVELEARPRKAWAELLEAHPPREDRSWDKSFTIDWDHFLADVLPASVVAVRERATGEPVEVAAAEWAEIVGEITDGQYQAFALAVLTLNRDTENPF